MKYLVTIRYTSHTDMTYEVEADDPGEAEEKAEAAAVDGQEPASKEYHDNDDGEGTVLDVVEQN